MALGSLAGVGRRAVFVGSRKLGTVNTFFLSFKHKSGNRRVLGSATAPRCCRQCSPVGRGRGRQAAAWWSREGEVERDCCSKMPCVGGKRGSSAALLPGLPAGAQCHVDGTGGGSSGEG